MALIALGIPAPDRPESHIEESCSRAHLNEGIEAAPQSQVRPSALPCKACWPAATLLLLCLATLAQSRRGSMLLSYKASASMAPSGAVAPKTTPASAGYYLSSLQRGPPFKWVHSNDCIRKVVTPDPDKESVICCLHHNYSLLMSRYDTPALAVYYRPSPRRGSPLKFSDSNDLTASKN
jgi:hypothetical protein